MEAGEEDPEEDVALQDADSGQQDDESLTKAKRIDFT